MKLLKFEIVDDCLLEITCKRPSFFKSYLEEIDKVVENMSAKNLGHKYFGWSFDINNNIVFIFRLLDADKDIKPYCKYSVVGGKK